MKRVFSALLLFLMVTSLFACSSLEAAPKTSTVILTAGNFEQYFDLDISIENTGLCGGEFNADGYYCSIYSATATISMEPKFEGTWSNVQADLEWDSYNPSSVPIWSQTEGLHSKIEFDLPDELDGESVGSVEFTYTYMSDPTYVALQYRAYVEESYPQTSNVRTENVSGTITVVNNP